jgi:hypothetical protein
MPKIYLNFNFDNSNTFVYNFGRVTQLNIYFKQTWAQTIPIKAPSTPTQKALISNTRKGSRNKNKEGMFLRHPKGQKYSKFKILTTKIKLI